jgi:hypothetical protein
VTRGQWKRALVLGIVAYVAWMIGMGMQFKLLQGNPSTDVGPMAVSVRFLKGIPSWFWVIANVPYSGPTTLGVILAVTGDVSRFSNYRKYVAYTGYYAGLQKSQTIDRTKMSRRGNRTMKRVLFQIAAPLVWFDKGDNPYKQLFQRKVAEGREWYKAMPFVCAALTRHIYHCLKFNDPYDVEKAFRGSSLCPASEEEWLSLGASLDDRFEEMEASLCLIEQ